MSEVRGRRTERLGDRGKGKEKERLYELAYEDFCGNFNFGASSLEYKSLVYNLRESA
jgi:hypothetical protein